MSREILVGKYPYKISEARRFSDGDPCKSDCARAPAGSSGRLKADYLCYPPARLRGRMPSGGTTVRVPATHRVANRAVRDGWNVSPALPGAPSTVSVFPASEWKS